MLSEGHPDWNELGPMLSERLPRWNEPAPLWSQRFAPDGKRRRCGANQSHCPVRGSLQGMNGSLQHGKHSVLTL